jgi:hypothetical protein
MKSLTHTMIALCVFNLAIGGFAFAQDSTGEKTTTYTISGSVRVPGVVMKGLPGDVISDEQGRYSVTVPHDWTGTVTPAKEGHFFEPQGRIYKKLDGDRIDDDYRAHVIAYTISGQVGVGGVLLKGLPNDPISNNEGVYKANVPYGWAGVVIPTKEGYVFQPPRRTYSKTSENLPNEDYAPTAVAEGANSPYDEMYGPVYSPARGRTRRSTGYPPAIGPIGSRKVLVVPAEEVKPEYVAAITEDLQVMSYILDERFKETRRIQGVFTDFGDFFGRDNRQTEATWLQGYGVLFAMEVSFSFSPPPKAQPQQAEPPGEQADSTWQRARQQVFSPGEFDGPEGSGSAEEYNSQVVEELKRDLITTLKHAANIRGLQPDEWVILTLVGGRREFGGGFGGRAPMMTGMSSMSSGSAYGNVTSSGAGGGFGGYSTGGFVSGGVGGGMGMGGGMMGGMGGGMMGGMGGGMAMGFSSSTVLTIRARKSDVDAFAKGELTLDQFQEQVKILMY